MNQHIVNSDAPSATHLMHFEESRYALYRETQNFLAAGDVPASLV